MLAAANMLNAKMLMMKAEITAGGFENFEERSGTENLSGLVILGQRS